MISWLLSVISIPSLLLWAWLPVVLVLITKYWIDNRPMVSPLVVQDICYGPSTFGVVVVMIRVDGEWRPATAADVPYLPRWVS